MSFPFLDGQPWWARKLTRKRTEVKIFRVEKVSGKSNKFFPKTGVFWQFLATILSSKEDNQRKKDFNILNINCLENFGRGRNEFEPLRS